MAMVARPASTSRVVVESDKGKYQACTLCFGLNLEFSCRVCYGPFGQIFEDDIDARHGHRVTESRTTPVSVCCAVVASGLSRIHSNKALIQSSLFPDLYFAHQRSISCPAPGQGP